MVLFGDHLRSRPFAGLIDSELVEAFHMEGDRAFGPVDFDPAAKVMGTGHPRCLERGGRTVLELGRADEGVVVDVGDLARSVTAPGLGQGADPFDLPDQEACLVDVVRAEVTERAQAGFRAAEAPRELRVRRQHIQQKTGAVVADLAEFACVDHLPCQLERGDRAVRESAEMVDSGLGHALPDFKGLVCRAGEGLFAKDVLAGAR